MEAIDSEVLTLLEGIQQKQLERRRGRRYATQAQVAAAVKTILERVEARAYEQRNGHRPKFSLCQMVRGIAASRGRPLIPETAAADVQVVKALVTGSVPGSYMIPTIASDQIISQLAQFAVARSAGAIIVPMRDIQKLTMPAAIASMGFVWAAQNSKIISSDPNYGMLTFDLATAIGLVALPAQLFRVAAPGWDTIFEDSLSLGCSEIEDLAMFSASTPANGPQALLATSGISVLNVAGSGNGGNISWSDVNAVIQKSIDLKLKPTGLCWFMGGRTLNRLLSLQDSSSRPLLLPIPGMVGADGAASAYSLMGFPVFPSASFPVNLSVGSGSNQSFLVFAPARGFFIGESGEIEMAISWQMALDSDEIVLRVQHRVAFQYGPAASLITLQGIN